MPCADILGIANPTPRQLQFLETIAHKRFVLYGGAAGGGKSYILRWWLLIHLMQLANDGICGAQVGLFCEDYASLTDRQIGRIEAEFPADIGEMRRNVTRDFILRPEYGGGRILLRNLDDPSKYLSAEFAAIAVDELTRDKQDVFDFLRLRLRWPGVGRPRFAAGTNPGGKGHAWVKALWIDRKFPAELEPLQDEFAFVPARAEDNPYLPATYYSDLDTLPRPLAEAYKLGSWDLFLGKYFDVFDPVRHVIVEPKLEPWWSRWISVDWGFEHPTVAYWHAQNGGQTITYREMVRRHVTPAEIGADIASLSANEKIGAVYLSPDAFSWRSFAGRRSERPISELIGDALVERGVPQPSPADDDRIGGWMLMYQMLERGDWAISADCARLIGSLPNLVRDAKRVEDIAKQDGDDPADAARYGLKSRLGPARPPLEVRVQERLAALPPPTSPTGHAMQMGQAIRAEQQKQKPVFVRGTRFHRRWN